jgi:hypothetical protein
MKPRHPLALALLALLLVAALAGCGGSASSEDKAGRGSGASAATDDSAVPGSAPGSDEVDARDSSAAKPASVVDTLQRAVIATGVLRLTTKDLAAARQDAINVATGLHGYVGDEESQSDHQGKLDRVDLTLRVPSESFEKALDGLAALGTVRHREQSVEDVTTKVIDTSARVRAQKASVASIQQLLARAGTIAEIMSIEAQLATRQADLDSLEQQQRYLADQTSLSTIQLTMTHPAAAAEHRADQHATGFLAGLRGGWHALGGTAVAVGTVLGAVLPFGVLLALVGVPAWLVVRRRRTTVPLAGS